MPSGSLEAELEKRILVLDGAMGTALQAKNLTAADFGGEAYEGCNENLVLTRPDVIESVHTAYFEAGADIVETNTFGATPLVLAEYGLEAKAIEINVVAAQLARRAALRYATAERPRFVAGSIGPTTKAISVTGGVTFPELIDHFYVQIKALVEGGVDYLLIETCQDTRNIKAALQAARRFFAEGGRRVPVAVSATIEPMGTMLAGQSAEALAISLAHEPLLYIGLNCATGPAFMTDHIRTLAEVGKTRVACVPNAGLPDEDGRYLETPQMVSQVLSRFCENSWVNLLGGCCGTTAPHVKAMAELAARYAPRKIPHHTRSFLSGVDALEIVEANRPYIVGERTNVIGSRKFKRLICEEKYDEASEVARAQVKSGAHVIDVCLANPDRDEPADMRRFLSEVVKKIRAPLMIDSTDDQVIAEALTYSQGKALINSINLEDGEARFEKVVPLARAFGAALVVGTIDDDPQQGMGVKRERKLAIAKRSYALLTEKYDFPAEDIYWDPLVFPCATGDAQYVGSAVETIEGVRLIKQAFPLTKTVLGISNVSFGLPESGREVLNSVFLYHCVQAGLDLAIVNAEKLERYASIPEKERRLAEDLLWNRGDDPVARFAEAFREARVKEKRAVARPLDERLAAYIVEGTKDGLSGDLDEALKTRTPLEIVNGPLMTGMNEVGRLFNKNELIVAEVLQSAEAMKAAVAHLEPHMEKNESASRGKVLLATVKGDVHDIGKNLVDIIFSNNGFEVVDLGIKVPPEQLIAAIRNHKPHIVGLSGLLVKSAQQMEITAQDFSTAGIHTPMLVGGAALSRNFVDKRIAKNYIGTVEYASDAMHGLDIAKRIVNAEDFSALKSELEVRRAALKSAEGPAPSQEQAPVAVRPAQISRDVPIPEAPDFARHVLSQEPLDLIFRYVNPLMLYTKHLGVKGLAMKAVLDPARRKDVSDEEFAKAEAIHQIVLDLKDTYRSVLLAPRAVYQFFPARSEGNGLLILNEDRQGVRASFNFPRQAKGEGLCLADYTHPSAPDSIALFITTVGKGVREEAERLKRAGDYLKSHALQSLAIECAEAFAELLHARLRAAWGFSDPPEMTLTDRFQAKYRGKRYSFGYPACPRLEDQTILFDLLKPEDIGVHLTEGFMMEPEASVSALVFHHPEARYFSVGGEGT